MGTYRKRFNEKARAGQLAKLKELKRIRNKQFLRHLNDGNDSGKQDLEEDNQTTIDSNANILAPVSTAERAREKRKLEELFQPKESKVSRLKKKRLDKFIEHQLQREEKRVLLEKLQDYKVDTDLLMSSKRLGEGRLTKRQQISEALELERQGRGNDRTREILYEEHEPLDWNDDKESSESDVSSDTSQENNNVLYQKQSTSGFGSAFQNIRKVTRKPPKKNYNWRQRLMNDDQKKHKLETEMDFETSEGSDHDIDNTDSTSDNESDSNLQSSEEFEATVTETFHERKHHIASAIEKETPVKEDMPSQAAEEFKNWAISTTKEMEGSNTEHVTPTLPKYLFTPTIRQEDLDDGLGPNDSLTRMDVNRDVFYVTIERSEELQKSRMMLPVFGEEHKIMEAIHHNDTVLICGETGSGKTTQIPQFLYESGYGHPDSPDTPGMIGITQPRRVATISMASRVANELGNHGDKVAHQIRFDSTVSDSTRLKFMTDGVLLREMAKDFELSKYSCIIIDEAHERNINTDILIGMLSRCVKLRMKRHMENPGKYKRLKLVIMSATLRVSDFSENSRLFNVPPPVIHIAARQYPVAIHFNRRTPHDYLDEAFKKTCKIHQRLPRGAILLFLTGQKEINEMVKRLRREFPFPNNTNVRKEMDASIKSIKIDSKSLVNEVEDLALEMRSEFRENNYEYVESDMGNYDPGNFNEAEDEDDSEEEGFEENLEEGQSAQDPLYVLPLYSLLPTKEQMKVFKSPPKGSRLCIVATNVAETSLTIPGVKYVVDCGRSKERKYNKDTGVQGFEVDWISKASAEQRSGRAGRTGPGHCYRLYSSAVFEEYFNQFSAPEILRMPVESVVLQMKSMAIHNIDNFPFPTPPDHSSLSKASELLQYLGALDNKGLITQDGQSMSLFPLSPRFSKMLLVSNEHACLPYIVTIVSGLSVGDPFLSEIELGIASKGDETADETSDTPPKSQEELERKKNLRAKFIRSRSRFNKLDNLCDIFSLLSVISALDYVPRNKREHFVKENFLRLKVVDEIIKLRQQLYYIVKANTSSDGVSTVVRSEDLKAPVPNQTQLKLLKQMICTGFIDKVAIRADYLYPEENKITNGTSMTKIPYIPVLSTKSQVLSDMFVYIHPTSLLCSSGELPPKYLVYHTLNRGLNGTTRLQSLCDIKSTPLANVARKGSLLSYSKPLTGKGLKIMQVSPTERYCYVVPHFGATINSDLKIGWDLNPIAVHQIKSKGKWTVTKFITNSHFKNLADQVN